jgi:hypothetical protein
LGAGCVTCGGIEDIGIWGGGTGVAVGGVITDGVGREGGWMCVACGLCAGDADFVGIG